MHDANINPSFNGQWSIYFIDTWSMKGIVETGSIFGVLASGHVFFWYKCKKWGALQKATAHHQDHDISWFGIPINLCFLPLLGGGFGIPPQSSILVDPLCAQVR